MKPRMTVEEALKKLKRMSVEEGARLDAETPPFKPETNPRKMFRIMPLPFPLPEENTTKE